MGGGRQVGLLFGGAVASTFLITNAQDVAVWVHCAVSGCAPGSEAVFNAKMAGLGGASLISVVIVAYVVRKGRQPVPEAIALIIGLVASGLFQILKSGVGDELYPNPSRVGTALYIWTQCAFLLLIPLTLALRGANHRSPFRTLARIGLAALSALLLSVILSAGLRWGYGASRVEYLQSYAVTGCAAAWSVLVASAFLTPVGTTGSQRHRGTFGIAVAVLAAAISFGYGPAVGVSSGSGFAHGVGAPRLVAGLGSLVVLGVPLACGTLACLAAFLRKPAWWSFCLCGAATVAAIAAAKAALWIAAPGFASRSGGMWPDGFTVSLVAQTLVTIAAVRIGPWFFAETERRLHPSLPPAPEAP